MSIEQEYEDDPKNIFPIEQLLPLFVCMSSANSCSGMDGMLTKNFEKGKDGKSIQYC